MISQKGGAGKTTMAVALAVAAEQRGLPSVLIDLDPQASTGQWGDQRSAATPVVTCTPAVRLAPVLAAAQTAGAALAVIDTTPHATDAALAAARASDLILIPCRPAAADLRAIRASIDLARLAATPCAVVLNAAPPANPLTQQGLAAIAGYGVAACPVVLHQRIAHVHAFTEGQTATETAPQSKAAVEVAALFTWLQERIPDGHL